MCTGGISPTPWVRRSARHLPRTPSSPTRPHRPSAPSFPASTRAGLTTTYTVPVTAGPQGRLSWDAEPGDVPTPNRISITFPAGYAVPASPPANSITVNGSNVTTASVAGRVLTVSVPNGVTIPDGGTATVVLKSSFGMANPAAGSYTLQATTTAETGTGTSPSFTIVPGVSAAITAPTTGQVLTGVSTTIAGTASDAGPGVSGVDLMIVRSDGQYWDGVSGWTLVPTLFSATGTTNWSYPWLLPSDHRLFTYTVTAQARAVDGAVSPPVSVGGVLIDNMFTLTYAAGANGTITGTTPQTVPYNGSGTAVTAVPDTGYHFVSWSDGVTTATRTDANVTADKSVTATFAINTYTITATAGATARSPAPRRRRCDNGSGERRHGATGFDSTADRTSIDCHNVIAHTYTITATAGANGSIAPAGDTVVNSGGSQSYTISASLRLPRRRRPRRRRLGRRGDVLRLHQRHRQPHHLGHLRHQHLHDHRHRRRQRLHRARGRHGRQLRWQPVLHDQRQPRLPRRRRPRRRRLGRRGDLLHFTNVTADHTISATFAINTYTITATAGANGSITPAGDTVRQLRWQPVLHDQRRRRLPRRRRPRRRRLGRRGDVLRLHQRDRRPHHLGHLRLMRHLHDHLHRRRQRLHQRHEPADRHRRFRRCARHGGRRPRLPLRGLVRRPHHRDAHRPRGRGRHHGDCQLRDQHLHHHARTPAPTVRSPRRRRP